MWANMSNDACAFSCDLEPPSRRWLTKKLLEVPALLNWQNRKDKQCGSIMHFLFLILGLLKCNPAVGFKRQ